MAKVVSDGRVTIPNELREILQINDGDFVECSVTVVKHASAQAGDRIAS